jgi:hypothetical protein
LDGKGRVFHKWSTGRYGKVAHTDKPAYHPASKGKTQAFPQKNETGTIQKYK